MQMTIVDIESYLSSAENRMSSMSGTAVSYALAALKADAVVVNDDVTAKKLWCFETALSAQEHYLQAFSMMKEGRFYDAWCRLEHAELDLRFLERHKGEWWNTFELDFIQAAVERWQGLSPYKLFLSPELIEKEKKCSICGQVVAPASSVNCC
jgi:hypothetical protein